MLLYGKEYSADDLRRCVGNLDQIAGIRLSRLEEGNERPVLSAHFRTGAGLEFTVLPGPRHGHIERLFPGAGHGLALDNGRRGGRNSSSRKASAGCAAISAAW